MENSTLYQQKVMLLSRLVKENAVTFEEALLLLKNDDLVQDPPEIGTATTEGVKDFIQKYFSATPWRSFANPTITHSGYQPVGSGIVFTSNDSISTINSAADLNT